MRQHTQQHKQSGGRPAWLEEAHKEARRIATLNAPRARITTREERNGKREVTTVVAETRTDVPIPAALKDLVKSLFTKENATARIRDHQVVELGHSRTLVVVFKKPQNGIRGLPVRKAEAGKLRKLGYTHAVIQALPEAAKLEVEEYGEGGWRLEFYKPKGGHRKSDERGGELVHDTQDELSVLQFLFESDLRALYECPLLTSWKTLPMTDDERERQNGVANMVQALFGRSGGGHPPASYHRARLLRRFEKLFSDGEPMADERARERAREAFEGTKIGQEVIRRFEAGTFEESSFYVSSDTATAYAIHNAADGQYVVKVVVPERSVEIGLVKRDEHGNALMELYDDFLRSSKFHRITAHEYAARTRGISLIKLV